MVLAQSLRPVAAGLAIGVAGAAGLTRLMTGMLYGVKPGDPAVLAVVTAILGLVALAAAMGPARRAASVDPLVALREE
jgi:ABC-type antimicrobial peptide transport system permease subunit